MARLLRDLLLGYTVARKPVWLMRQAGRYLPEYRTTRQQAGSFLDLCLAPELAAEVTLQPIRRFGLDAAIIFADILLVPYGLGLDLQFREGEGPVLPPCRTLASLQSIRWDRNRVAAVADSLRRTRAALPDETALIGFAGSPWTVACYMLEGHGKTGFTTARELAQREPALVTDLITLLEQATLDYLALQIDAGAEIIQLFDSWAGLAPDFAQWVIAPTRRIIATLKQTYPHTQVIGFPRGASMAQYQAYAAATGIAALGLDQSLTLADAKLLQATHPVQGNLDPDILVQGGAALHKAVDDLLHQLGPAHIINLGHGVVPQTPPEHVKAMVDQVKEFRFDDHKGCGIAD
jgi:uroporphyrinogen decarboxylase